MVMSAPMVPTAGLASWGPLVQSVVVRVEGRIATEMLDAFRFGTDNHVHHFGRVERADSDRNHEPTTILGVGGPRSRVG